MGEVPRLREIANFDRVLVSVTPGDRMDVAITRMTVEGYSQLPVLSGRTCKGAVTWRVVGRSLVDRTPPVLVGDCELDEAPVLDADEDLRAAIRVIVASGFVLVRNTGMSAADGPPFAIITTADLALRLLHETEAFLLIHEIEVKLRGLLAGVPAGELAVVRDPVYDDRPVTSAGDLTLGEMQRWMEKPDRWETLGLRGTTREEFIRQFDRVRTTRNDISHGRGRDPGADARRQVEGFLALLEHLLEWRT